VPPLTDFLALFKGSRVIVSTQNPSILDPELIELSNAVIMHRFSSPSW
jgi:DNA helicase HerA-like ATPase